MNNGTGAEDASDGVNGVISTRDDSVIIHLIVDGPLVGVGDARIKRVGRGDREMNLTYRNGRGVASNVLKKDELPNYIFRIAA